MALADLIKEMEKQILKETQSLPGEAEKGDSGPAAPRITGERDVFRGKLENQK